MNDHHFPCPCGAELADECPKCARSNPFGSMRLSGADPAPTRPRIAYGLCTACGSVEVALVRVNGRRDLSHLGESSNYPTGYGCEVCS